MTCDNTQYIHLHIGMYTLYCSSICLISTCYELIHLAGKWQSTSQPCNGETSPQAKLSPVIPPASNGGYRTSPIELVVLQWLLMSLEDQDHARWIELQSLSPQSMAQAIHNGQMQFPEFSSQKQHMKSSHNTMTILQRQLQNWPTLIRPHLKARWITMVLPDQ